MDEIQKKWELMESSNKTLLLSHGKKKTCDSKSVT
jgi:hypothetical protein